MFIEVLFVEVAEVSFDVYVIYLCLNWVNVEYVVECVYEVQDVVIKVKCGIVCGWGVNQVCYLYQIIIYDINFGIGLVGIGKIFLVVVSVVEVFNELCVQWLILVCLVVEVGEKLGFLFGDFSQKVDFYLCLLYDVLYEMFGVEKVFKLLEKNIIEIVLLVYMCGCMFNDVFVILDEVQNIIVEQMKMFLIWLGFGFIVVVIGDFIQIDLFKYVKFGLCDVIEVLCDVEGVSFIFFEVCDVVCYLLVVCIVSVYDCCDLQQVKLGVEQLQICFIVVCIGSVMFDLWKRFVFVLLLFVVVVMVVVEVLVVLQVYVDICYVVVLYVVGGFILECSSYDFDKWLVGVSFLYWLKEQLDVVVNVYVYVVGWMVFDDVFVGCVVCVLVLVMQVVNVSGCVNVIINFDVNVILVQFVVELSCQVMVYKGYSCYFLVDVVGIVEYIVGVDVILIYYQVLDWMLQ